MDKQVNELEAALMWFRQKAADLEYQNVLLEIRLMNLEYQLEKRVSDESTDFGE